MRASKGTNEGSRHVSGAERIVLDGELTATVDSMLERARRKEPDHVSIVTELVDFTACAHVQCLPIQTVNSKARDRVALAKSLLDSAGISSTLADEAIHALQTGLGANGGVMRGASIWDSQTGDRLEPDRERGVRTSRFDYSSDGAKAIDKALARANLTHFRTREAVAVATKTLWAGVLAEICWSDEPDYTTGYIATPNDGYVRIPNFKPDGAAGGRIFFVDRHNLPVATIIQRLEKEYVLIEPLVTVTEFQWQN